MRRPIAWWKIVRSLFTTRRRTVGPPARFVSRSSLPGAESGVGRTFGFERRDNDRLSGSKQFGKLLEVLLVDRHDRPRSAAHRAGDHDQIRADQMSHFIADLVQAGSEVIAQLLGFPQVRYFLAVSTGLLKDLENSDGELADFWLRGQGSGQFRLVGCPNLERGDVGMERRGQIRLH